MENFTKVTVENGKYTFIIDDQCQISIDRFGKPWVSKDDMSDVPAPKALISLIHELEDARNEIKSLEDDITTLQEELDDRIGEIESL